MRFFVSLTLVFLAAACAQAASPLFPLSADGLFTGSPQDFLLRTDELGADYFAPNAGASSPNSRVLNLRPDGQAYIDATGRRAGWQVQYNRSVGDGPSYIVNVVNIYDRADGPHLALSREWHKQVWERIDNGELALLPSIPDFDYENLVWKDANGTIGVEIAYRNLYIFFTGPTDNNADQYDFFANLAKAHIEWIQAGEP
jgi:hypothetical protein